MSDSTGSGLRVRTHVGRPDCPKLTANVPHVFTTTGIQDVSTAAITVVSRPTHGHRICFLEPPSEADVTGRPQARRTLRLANSPTCLPPVDLPHKISLKTDRADFEKPVSVGMPTREAPLPTVEQIFLEHLRTHRSKNPRPNTRLLTLGMSLEDLQADFHRFLGSALATGTWNGYGRVWQDMTEFAQELRLPVSEYAACLFLRRSMLTPNAKGKFLLVSTVYGYSKNISAVSGRIHSPLWNQGFQPLFNRILVKMGAKVPTTQAQPILRHQIYDTMENPDIAESEKMLLYLSWKSASRADDLAKAHTDDTSIVLYKGIWYVVIRWVPKAAGFQPATGRGSGSQKNSANGLGHSCVLDCGEFLPRVRAYLLSRKGQSISPYTTAQSTRWIKKHISPALSAHSIKRGALQYLMEMEVDMRVIVEMARHANDWIPITTRVYLQPVPLALAIGTQRGTRVL